MKKDVKLIVVFFALLLVLAIPVYAIGGGEGGRGDSDSNSDEDDTGTGEDQQEINCESFTARVDRIKCRISSEGEYSEPAGILPEACRIVPDTAGCQGLYRSVEVCYRIQDGREKNRCFMRAAGFDKSRISDEDNEKDAKTRKYLVVLLYDLEEKAEKANQLGSLNDEQSALLIDKIISIKQDILSGASKENIRLQMQELRRIWRPEIE